MEIIKSKSGFTLLFVLAAMLMLMTLGISVLTAAAQSQGSNNQQQERNRLNLYASSMERVLNNFFTSSMSEELTRWIIDYISLEDNVFQIEIDYSNIYPSGFDDDMRANFDVEISVEIDGKIKLLLIINFNRLTSEIELIYKLEDTLSLETSRWTLVSRSQRVF